MKPVLSKNRLLLAAAPLVLVIVAIQQLYLAHTEHLTPWKGGGFGMFSTVDSRAARFLRIYVSTADGEVPVEVPRQLQSFASEIRSIPTRDRVTQLAYALAQTTWVPTTPGAQLQRADDLDLQDDLDMPDLSSGN